MLGAAKSRQHTSAPDRADELAEIDLLDVEGESRRLGDYWRDRPAVFVFLRHYG
jgi:hypothetical protein